MVSNQPLVLFETAPLEHSEDLFRPLAADNHVLHMYCFPSQSLPLSLSHSLSSASFVTSLPTSSPIRLFVSSDPTGNLARSSILTDGGATEISNHIDKVTRGKVS